MKKNTPQRIALIGICSAILITLQVALSPLPNVEIVSLLIILYSLLFRRETPFIIYTFVLVEGIIYGFHMWWFSYLYCWTLLYFVCLSLRNMTRPLVFAIVSGLFGLCFGALSAIPYLLASGWQGAVAYFVNGVVFDLIHCVSNFLIALALFKPLRRALEKGREALHL